MSYKKQQNIICVKSLKLGSDFFGGKTDISHGDLVLSSCYFFFQQTITEHNSVLLMGGRSRSNSVEEITLLLFGSLFDLCVCDF